MSIVMMVKQILGEAGGWKFPLYTVESNYDVFATAFQQTSAHRLLV